MLLIFRKKNLFSFLSIESARTIRITIMKLKIIRGYSNAPNDEHF